MRTHSLTPVAQLSLSLFLTHTHTLSLSLSLFSFYVCFSCWAEGHLLCSQIREAAYLHALFMRLGCMFNSPGQVSGLLEVQVPDWL